MDQLGILQNIHFVPRIDLRNDWIALIAYSGPKKLDHDFESNPW